MHLMKNANPISDNSLKEAKNLFSIFLVWFLASRPKTWIASISPVLIGAFMSKSWDNTYVFLCLFFALFLQIGCNFANDYFDFIKKADTEERIGPKRAVQQGWICASKMKQAFIIVLSFAFLLSIPLIIKVHPLCLILSLISILCAIYYTGGKKPLGYQGLGEILVFLFFGPIATIGTYTVLNGNVTTDVVLASLSPGLISSALLIANNLRDKKTDEVANKKTIIVRFGETFGKILFSICLIAPCFLAAVLWIFFNAPHNLLSAFCLIFMAMTIIKMAFKAQNPKQYVQLLPLTSLFFLFYTLLFCLSYGW